MIIIVYLFLLIICYIYFTQIYTAIYIFSCFTSCLNILYSFFFLRRKILFFLLLYKIQITKVFNNKKNYELKELSLE